MYALSDPLKYQSDREKHSKMIQQMGVDDPDDEDRMNKTGLNDEVVTSVSAIKKGSKSGNKDEAGVSASTTREIGKLVSRNSSAVVAGALSLLDKSDRKSCVYIVLSPLFWMEQHGEPCPCVICSISLVMVLSCLE